MNWTVLAQQDKQAILPPGSVDGSVNPELIPDIVAYRLFFSAVGEIRTQGPAENFSSSSLLLSPSPKQKAKLNPIRLNGADQNTVVEALSEFKGKFQDAVSTKSGSQSWSVNAQKSQSPLDDAAQSAVDSLKSRMSPDGFERLQAYVQEQKKYMKIVPFPQMSEHHK